ncbi:hypothetical protein BV22DRAFT_49757 [Leucogyrophana mollusca]|uniref:Uncharacterized protein n=1 Tax=Leucogyrophana mollusca TaxID=85980 RepID=A0ACB8BYF2_9AGAM|nr:hypothetical protein BV22DRAFT_49757 [Leucogyrophana mollusca]
MTTLVMASNAHDEREPLRSTRKAENRFYAFFRSRSRSRSKSTPASSIVSSEVKPLPVTQPRILHTRHSSLYNENADYGHVQDSAVATSSKPPTRSQSRPISSTTTATHSTIAPLPSDTYRSKSRITRSEYVHEEDDESNLRDPDSQDHRERDEFQSDDRHDRVYRPETPSSTARRKLGLHNIFGISLSRKNSSGSTRKTSSSISERKPSSSGSSHQDSSISDRKGTSSTSSQRPPSASRKRSFRLNSRPSTPKASDDAHTPKSSTHPLPVPSSPLPLSASPRRLSFGLASTSQSHVSKPSSGHHLPSGSHRSYGSRRLSASSQQTPHDSAVALPEETIPENCSNADLSNSCLDPSVPPNVKHKDYTTTKPWLAARFRSRSNERPATDYMSHSAPTPSSPIASMSAPPSPHHRPSDGYDHDHADIPPVPILDPAPHSGARSTSPRPPLPAIPQIIHTPPTPQRPGQAQFDSPVRLHASPSKLGPGKGKQREVVVRDPHDQPVTSRSPLPISGTQSRSNGEAATKPNSKYDAHASAHQNVRTRARFSPRLFGGKDLPKEKEPKGKAALQMDGGTKPSGGLAHPPHGATSVGPPRNMTSRRAKHGSFDFERPVSGLNRSNSTVNGSVVHSLRTESSSAQLPRNVSTIHRPLPLERTTSESSSRTGRSRTYAYHPAHAESPLLAPLTAHHTGASVASFSSASASAQSKSTGKGVGGGPGGTGLSSSWGRAAGRRAQRTSHGAFSFEPAVSAPNSPVPPTSTLPISPLRTDFEPLADPASLPLSSPLRTEFEMGGGYGRGTNRSARGRDTGVKRDWQREREPERKSRGKGKGHSLDLGLGLSWAPNRVREEAIMPGLFLSRSNSRKAASRRGRDVTKVFENVLSEASFEAFKKYVHHFDAHTIPLDGPSGLLSRVEKLLSGAGVGEREKAELLGEFATFVEGHGEYPI